MGLLIKPAEVKSQTTSMIRALSNESDTLEGVLPAIETFASNTSLDGAAWSGLKGQLTGHRAIIRGIITANEEMIGDSEALASAVGSEELDEDKLKEELERCQKANQGYGEIISSYQNQIRSIQSQAIGLGTLSEGLVGYYTRQIQNKQALIDSNKAIIQKLEEKLETLYEIESSTSSLYSEAASLYELAQQGTSDLSNSWTGTGFAPPVSSSWQTALEKNWTNTKKKKMERELRESGWDEPAIDAYKKEMEKRTKGLVGDALIAELNKLHKEIYLVGSEIYDIMFTGSELTDREKVELVIQQMGGSVDEHGFLQLSGKYRLDPNMSPHSEFLHKFTKCVQNTFPDTNLRDEGALGQKVHLFKSYIDKNSIEFLRTKYPEEENDYERLKAYAKEYGIELDYSTGASLHNREMDGFTYTKNMKILAPKDLNDSSTGRMSEFIIDLETGNFVSQWNVYKKRPDGTYESDPSKYDPKECGDLANTESFNYGPSKGKNGDLPKGNTAHDRLDVKRPDDTAVREEATNIWQSENDATNKNNPGNYADIVKEGEVDYEAWQEVPESKKQEVYDAFATECRDTRRNNGFSDFWQRNKHLF